MLWVATIVALLLSVFVYRLSLNQQLQMLETATKDVANFRQEFAYFDSPDGSQYQIKYFSDRYSSGKNEAFRWRIRVPEGEKCNLFYHVGFLPTNGFPEKGHRLCSELVKGPIDLVLIVELEEETPLLKIGLFTETDELPLNQRGRWTYLREGDNLAGLGFFSLSKRQIESVPLDKVVQFDLESPYMIMKNYVSSEQHENGWGCMFWLEAPVAEGKPR